jgi:hypothetical protein
LAKTVLALVASLALENLRDLRMHNNLVTDDREESVILEAGRGAIPGRVAPLLFSAARAQGCSQVSS